MNLKKVLFTVTALTLLWAPGVWAAIDLPELDVEKYELANGLDVILYEDHCTPLVGVNIWYHVGSKNEKPGRTGFAHLFEHMMFQGSANHDTDYFMPLEKIGAFVNGSTTEDRTNYLENIPSNYLELAIWLEADRMGFLPAAMTQEKLDNQRDVVMNERRERVDNQPYGKVDEMMLEMMYSSDHPYYHSVIGKMHDLSVATLEDVKSFFNDYYCPNNASLCITGDFDSAEAKRLIDKYFATIAPGPPVDRMMAWIPKLDHLKRAYAQDNVPLPRLYMQWHTPGYYQPGDAEFDIISDALAGGKTSRLYKELVYERQIAQSVNAFQSSMELSSLFNITVTPKPGHSLTEIETAVDEILNKFLRKGITKSELADSKTSIEVGFIRAMEQIGGFGGLADSFNEYNVRLGDPDMAQWDLNRYREVTAKSLMAYAREYLDMDRRVILHVEPFGEPVAADQVVDRSVVPGPGPEPRFAPPIIQREQLDNGLEIMLIEDHTLPLIQANLIIKSGWAADPSDRPGAAALTAALLDEGTKSKSALEISEIADRIGANFSSGSFFDGSQLNLGTSTAQFNNGLKLLADVVLNPVFPEEELERLRKSYLTRIQQESSQPYPPAIKMFQRLLYGEDHPYGQPYTGTGTAESISEIDRTDLVAYYEKNYVSNNAAFVIAGDISMEDAKKAITSALKKWEPGEPTVARIDPPKRIDETKIYVIDRPGAPQSILTVGHEGIKRSDPDYLATTVMNYALGGSFISRINMNLREDKGYTYGAYSQLIPLKGVGLFVSITSVQTEVTKDAVFQLTSEIRDIQGSRPLSDDEVKESKDSLIKGFPQGFETIGAMAGQLSNIVLYDLPQDYLQTYMSKVAGINGLAATGAARNKLHPDNLIIVIVGDAQQVAPGLRELGIGPVEILNQADLAAFNQ
jgi:zinc protease